MNRSSNNQWCLHHCILNNDSCGPNDLHVGVAVVVMILGEEGLGHHPS